MTTIPFIKMSDTELLDAMVRAARDERRATAELLQLLAEVDARRLDLGEGCSSLFGYCTRVLHLSEHSAYHRIEAARTAREFPNVLDLIARGDVTLTTVAMLRRHLTPDNHEALLSAARHKSKREVEHQIACLAPKEDAQPLIRRLLARRSSQGEGGPEAREATSATLLAEQVEELTTDRPNLALHVAPVTAASTTAVPRPKVAPLASDRYLLRVTLSADAHAKLRRAQDLMRHTVPDAHAAEIVSRALTLLVDHLEKTKAAKTSRPRESSKPPHSRNRHIPAQVKREVWARDGGQCAFIGSHGRCPETGKLEFHHLIPFARGGPTDVGNLSLRCRAHNSYESESVFRPWLRQDSANATRSGPDRVDRGRGTRTWRPGSLRLCRLDCWPAMTVRKAVRQACFRAAAQTWWYR